jgi:hypothetical protein
MSPGRCRAAGLADAAGVIPNVISLRILWARCPHRARWRGEGEKLRGEGTPPTSAGFPHDSMVSIGAAGVIGISSAYLAAGLRFALRAGFAKTARRH